MPQQMTYIKKSISLKINTPRFQLFAFNTLFFSLVFLFYFVLLFYTLTDLDGETTGDGIGRRWRKLGRSASNCVRIQLTGKTPDSSPWAMRATGLVPWPLWGLLPPSPAAPLPLPGGLFSQALLWLSPWFLPSLCSDATFSVGPS